MKTENYYIYYPEKIKIIGIVPLQRLNYYMRSYNLNKRIYFYRLWLNSMSYIFEYLSYKEIFMMVKSMSLDDIPDELILDILKNYNIDDQHFYIYTNFKWNRNLLYSTFRTKKEVDKFKRSIINKYNRKKVSETKEQLVLNYIKNNEDITKQEFIDKLKKDVCSKTINKILKNNNIELKKVKKSHSIIDDKLNNLFTYRIDSIKVKLTNDLLADYCGVSLATFKRYIKDSDYKKEIINFNKTIKQK